jgi:serine/threonine protein kinase
MESNINILTINKYFSQNKEKQSNIVRTKIVNHSPFFINEANIADIIKQIPYYSNYFSILDDYEVLNISQLNDEALIQKIQFAEDKKYYLFKYADRNSYDFSDFIYNSQSIKKLIFDVIHSFQHILYGLHLLNENDVCFFDISPKNIVFLEHYREKPILRNFKFSLNLNKLNYRYFSPILNRLEDFTFQPLENHILFYFVKHDDMVTISHSFIDEFCENFVENLNILRLFSENYKKSYKGKCIEIMRKYINLSRQEIIEDILERNDKWDVYGISVLYLQIFGCISRVFSLKGTFISKITLELSKNLHPDSDKRMSLEETLNIFNKYLNEEDNWCFVNKLDSSKLGELFDDFAK